MCVSSLLNLSINNYNIMFVPWNLFLLLVPFFLAKLISRVWWKLQINKGGRYIISASLFLLWLIFIPNSAYVIMDMRHIAGFCTDSYYFNCIDKIWIIFFFFMYATVGFYGFVLVMKYSVHKFGEIIKNDYFRFFPYVIMPLVALGVLLGLVNRLNSWDVVIKPYSVLGNIKLYFVSLSHFKSLVITSFFYSFIYIIGTKIFKFPDKW